MNGFLVALRHSMDDIPLLLTASEDEALKFAEGVTENDGKTEMKVLELDASTPLNVCVYLFIAGKFVGCRRVKEFA